MVSQADGAKKSKPVSEFQSTLTRILGKSILPGDTPLKGKQLSDAAQFVLEIAEQREEDHSVIGMTSVTDEHRILRIAVINDDMPFLVDSVAAAVSAQGLAIDRIVHPIVPVRRNAAGKLTGLGKDDASYLKDKSCNMVFDSHSDWSIEKK